MSSLAPVPVGRPRRLVFLGTPAMAVPPLQALVASGFEIAAVITRPDRRRGRGGATSPSAVKQAAIELGLEVSESVDDVLGVGADLGVVVAFGQLIRRHVLESLPMVNLHFSLLPRWRGAAPVERAYLAGDAVTGVCLMQLEEGLDTGPVFARREVPIDPTKPAAHLRDELVTIGTAMLVEHLSEGLPHAVAQEGDPTYASKLTPADLHIDWTAPAPTIARTVGLGGAWTTFRGQRLKIVAAEQLQRPECEVRQPPGTITGTGIITGSDVLAVTRVQPEGRAAMPFAAWVNGARLIPGERVGE